MSEEFEAAVVAYLRVIDLTTRAMLFFVALLYVDRLWLTIKRLWRFGIMGALLLGAVPCFGQVDTSVTVTIDTKPGLLYRATNARLAQSGNWTSNGGGALWPGGYVVSNATGATVEWFCEWKIDAAPGRYDCYALLGGPTGLQMPPSQVAISAAPIVDNEYRSPLILREFDGVSGYGPNDAVYHYVNPATGADITLGITKLGSLTVWSGSRYLAARAQDHPNPNAVPKNTVMGALVLVKTGEVPTWQKYVGGDTDVTGYFDNLKPSDFRGLVVLPAVGPGAGGLALDNGAWDTGNATDNGGTPIRYVQLSFYDYRNPHDDQLTTFAWFIRLGRNGGLTANTVGNWAQNQGTPALGVVHNLTAGATSAWVRDPSQDHVVGTTNYYGWRYESQRRDSWRPPKYTKEGFSQVTSQWSLNSLDYCSRFPFDRPMWYWTPRYVGQAVTVTTAGGDAPTGYPLVGEYSAGPGQYSSLTPWGPDVESPTFAPSSVSLAPNATQYFRPIADFIYPINITHLELISQGALSDPPVGEGERRFCELIGEFLRAAKGDTTFDEYRAQVARGASDTVVVEGDDDSGSLPDDRPIFNSTIGASNGPERNVFNTPFPTGSAGRSVSVDLNDATALAGAPSNPALVLRVSSDLDTMRGYYTMPGWETLCDLLESYREWLRALMLFCVSVLAFWRQVSCVWKEI